jgi:hypothetical protein
MNALQRVRQYLDQALFGFKQDPASSDYQRGYEAALKEVQRWLND